MSVNRLSVAARVDAYTRSFFSTYVPAGDLPQTEAATDDELFPAQNEHPERPSWYRGRDRSNPDQDFRASR